VTSIGPLDLTLSQEFSSGKVLKVFVIGDNINWSQRSCEVMSPNFEGFKGGQEFLVVYIVIQLCRVEGLGVESNQMYLVACWRYCGQDFCQSIVGGIGFNGEWSIGDPMCEDWSSHEGFFECFK